MFNSEMIIKVATEFLKLFGELLILFVGVSFAVALLQIYISPDRIRNLLTTPNPVIITLFLAFFRLKATLIYAAFTFVFAVSLGLLLDRLGFVKEVKESVLGGCACKAAKSFAEQVSIGHLQAIKLRRKTLRSCSPKNYWRTSQASTTFGRFLSRQSSEYRFTFAPKQ